eukprot:jgi/Mesvir1/2191/Mv16695-RA.1
MALQRCVQNCVEFSQQIRHNYRSPFGGKAAPFPAHRRSLASKKVNAPAPVAQLADGFSKSDGPISSSSQRAVVPPLQASKKGAYGGIDRSDVPEWVKVLEEGAQSDEELMHIIKGTNGDPALIEARVRSHFEARTDEYLRLGSGLAPDIMKVSFREYDPFDLVIWWQFYSIPSEKEMELFEEVVKSWFVIGKLGGYNADNLQVMDKEAEVSGMEYDNETARNLEPAMFLNMGDFEYQGDWARCWFNLATADQIAMDILINAMTTFSVSHVGLKQMVVGGVNQDWADGLDAVDELDDVDDFLLDDEFTNSVWSRFANKRKGYPERLMQGGGDDEEEEDDD